MLVNDGGLGHVAGKCFRAPEVQQRYPRRLGRSLNVAMMALTNCNIQRGE